MGCIKLSILNEQYKRTELKVSYINKKLTSKNSAVNPRRGMLIKLVDPNGEEWEKASDIATAAKLKGQAEAQIEDKKATLKIYEAKKQTNYNKTVVNDLKKEINYLNEGIANIDAMGEDPDQKYHFDQKKSGNSFIQTRDDGVVNISHTSDGAAWHETVHIGDQRKNQGAWTLTTGNLWTTKSDADYARTEMKAYQSEFAFGSTFKYKLNDVKVTNLKGVREWVEYYGYDKR